MAVASYVTNVAAKRVVTARRSDDPAHASNNAGECRILLHAADMMMAALH